MSQPTAGMQPSNGPSAAAPTPDDKNLALIAHFGNIFTWGFAGIVIYVLKKDSSKWAAYHGLQAGIFGLVAGVIGSMVCVGPVVLLIMSVVAGLKIMNDEGYDYPLIGEKVREIVYGKG